MYAAIFHVSWPDRHAAGLIDLLFKGRACNLLYSCFAIQAGCKRLHNECLIVIILMPYKK